MSRSSHLLVPALLTAAVVSLATAAVGAQSDATAVAARVHAEATCVASVHAELGRWTALLRDLHTQLGRASTPAHRAEIAESITVVEGRVRDAATQLVRCVPAAPAEVPTEPEVAEPAPLHVISENLRVDVPNVTGRGRLDATAVHRALAPFGRAFEVCYDQLSDRHAIVRGRSTLHFDVRADGTIGGPLLPGFDHGDAAFQRCVRDALPRIDSPGRPSGGAVTVDVELTLGPES